MRVTLGRFAGEKSVRDEIEKTDKPCHHELERPIAATVASIIWIAFGCFSLLGAGLMMAGFLMVGAADGPVRLIFALLIVLIPCSFAAAFIFVGVQTVRRKARDTIGNGIGSIAIGLLYFAPMLKRSDSVQGVRAAQGLAFLAALLVVAGILALAGRSRYKAWRKAQIPTVVRNG